MSKCIADVTPRKRMVIEQIMLVHGGACQTRVLLLWNSDKFRSYTSRLAPTTHWQRNFKAGKAEIHSLHYLHLVPPR